MSRRQRRGSTFRRSRRARVLFGLAAALCLAVALLSGASSGVAGSLGSPTLSLSNTTAGATNVTYTYTFTTVSAMNLSQFTMTVPTGTGGSVTGFSVSNNLGYSYPSGGTLTLSGTTLTYTPGSMYTAASTVTITVNGLTNTSSPGTYTSAITSYIPTYPGNGLQDTGTTGSFSITGGTLTGTSWSASNAATGATGTAYTFGFTTATTATLTSVSMGVPSGTGGTPTVGAVSGLPSGGSVSLSGTTLTYSGFSQSTSASTTISIEIDGLTNTSTAGSYTSQLTTYAGSAPIDAGVSASAAFTSAVLTSPTWTVSNSAAGATGVTYTFGFGAPDGTLDSVTMSVPSGTAGTPAIGTVTSQYGHMPTNGTVTLNGTTLTYAFTSTYINSGPVSIEITGLTNTATLGNYTSQITTKLGAAAAASGVTGSVSISGGTLVSPIWTPSSTATGASASYTYTFTTATAATLTSVTMSVPTGTGGTPTVGTVSGIPSSGTASLSGTTLTYDSFSQSTPAGTAVSIQINGMTNTTTTGSYSSQLATKSSGSPIDTATTSSATFGGGTLVSPIWTSSSAAAAATGVTYTYTFKTASSSSSVNSVTMTVPPGTAGTPTLGTVTGVGAGTIALASNKLTYTLTTPANVNAATNVSIQVSGLTNTSSSGSYTSQITTTANGGGPTVPVDSGTTSAVAISGGGTLSSAIWAISNSVAGATGASYTYSFTTASTFSLTSVSMTVPPGTAGTPTLGTITGVPSGGSVSLAGNALTYTFSSTSVNAGTAVSIRINGMTNTTNVGTYTSQLVTHNGTTPIDTGTTAATAISGGALTSPIWTVSASAASATNVDYTYTFTTASGAALTTVTMTVPPGTSGTPQLGAVSSTNGALPTTGTVALAANKLTYTFASTHVNAAYDVSIQITGLTNTATPGNYTSQIATNTSTGPNDTGITGSVAFSGGTLASPIWAVSNPATSALGVSYTYTFTTASPATLNSVSMSVPPGTAGTPAVGTVTGLPATGNATLTGTTLTYDGFSQLVSAGTAVSIQITGMKNTATVGSYTSQIATSSANGPIDSGVTASTSISGGALTNPVWAVSTPSAGKTATYTYSFTSHSAATLTSVTMTVPPGTSGSPADAAHTGVPAASSVSLSGNTLTYSFGSAYLNSNANVSISISGLTNTATPDSYTAQLTTKDSHTPAQPVDTGFTGPVTIQLGTAYTAYVASSGNSAVVPLTVGAGAAGASISAGSAPWAIAIDPTATTAYAANSSANTLSPISIASGTAGTAIALTGCTTPKAVAITPDGTKAFVACSGNATVVSVTLSGGSVGAAISVGSSPLAIAVSPDGATAYAVNSGSGTLTPITVSSGATGSTISLSGCTTPNALALTPDGGTAYVTCSGSGTVVPVTLSSGSVGSAITVGTNPSAIAITPDGTRAYVANSGSNTVTPITISTGAAGTAIAVGTAPKGIAITPDGKYAYATNSSDSTVTPITISSNATAHTVSTGATPLGIAFTPDQAPVASFSVTPGAAGAATQFDASGTTVAYGTVASYSWAFGDGGTATTTSPTTSHVYAAGCSYTATVTVTSSAGTSTSRLSTGQTVSRNGNSAAATTRSVAVARTFGFVTTPGDLGFSGALTGLDLTLTSLLGLDVGVGNSTAGWSISATSTIFSTGGGTPRTLPPTAVTVQSAPTTACDGAAACIAPTNSVSYPYSLPAGSTAPPAAKLYSASATTGVCDQTVTPGFTLAVPGSAYAGSYSSTWTFTLSSGP